MARHLSSRFTTHLPGTLGLQVVCLVAMVQIALGLAGLVAVAAGVEWTPPTMVRNWQRAAEIVLLGGLALYLLQGAGRDIRVANLGALFLLIAVFFAHPPSGALALALPEGPAHAVRLFRAVTIDAFTPALAWLFARDFPRALESRASARVVELAIRASVAAALFLIAANLAIEIRGDAGTLALFDRNDAFGHYWTVCFGLLVPVAPFILWRMHRAPTDERRRVTLFGVGIALAGFFPVLLAVVPPWFPSLAEIVHGEIGAVVLVPMNLVLILGMAATTAYSVAVRHMLDVRTVLRKAAQYGLARIAIGALVGLPLLFIGIELYQMRAEQIASLFEAQRLLWLAGSVVAVVVVVLIRQKLIVVIDRLFFREPYDARSVLGALTESTRDEVSIDVWAKRVIGEIDRALHVESAGLLIATIDGEEFQPVAGALRRLPRDSVLARQILGGERTPIPIALQRPDAFFHSLPHDAQVWLADGDIELLVPLSGSAGSLPGILTLGPKRSELPFSRQDLLMLQAVAPSIGISLENRLLRESAESQRRAEASEEPASECTQCSRVSQPRAASCDSCGSPTHPSTLPYEVFGKFRVEERIGDGGMGVVYRAADLTLGRSVALKTLPARSPEDAHRLRREARTMAAITHPNLALILGVETWQGTPILVLEYLGGGTLAKRLGSGALQLAEVLELTRRMARVLEKIHRAGILHRDVKPSNIGFTSDGVPKLLDFGLARIVGETSPVVGTTFGHGQSETGFAGTPLYMCPEAFEMARPGAGFDLWSLSVVAFEATSGAHPFERANSAETLRAIRRGFGDELRASIPKCAEPIGDLFSKLLSGDPGQRPASAAEMADWIDDAESQCVVGAPAD